MIARIIIGLIIVAIGFFLLWKTPWFVVNFGRIPWFERHLHTVGGSYAAYKFFGLLFSFFGVLYITGLGPAFTRWLLGTLFGPAFPEVKETTSFLNISSIT